MKFITYSKENHQSIGVLSKDEQYVYELKTLGIDFTDMEELVKQLTEEDKQTIYKHISTTAATISINDIEIEAPIPSPKRDIICLGVNYTEHAKESAKYKKEAFAKAEHPVVFSKRVRRAVADKDGILAHEGFVECLDYEAELAVIIGKDAYQVKEENAFEYIFGYTIINDVSAREVQTRHKQWFLGKSLEGFCPMGPCIVTKEEFEMPPKVNISSKVNGELRQNSNTELLIFPIAQIISELSKGMLLEAGTIIATGTPAGVGMGFDPPKFLKVGDIVECEIEGIGKLTNPVIA